MQGGYMITWCHIMHILAAGLLDYLLRWWLPGFGGRGICANTLLSTFNQVACWIYTSLLIICKFKNTIHYFDYNQWNQQVVIITTLPCYWVRCHHCCQDKKLAWHFCELCWIFLPRYTCMTILPTRIAATQLMPSQMWTSWCLMEICWKTLVHNRK
jgi:hypothetical protein